jgi:hypothetical protein
MRRILASLAILLALSAPAAADHLPVVYGWHHITDPDGQRRWYWYQVTPADAETGWVADPRTHERVWWRWVYVPVPHVVITRTP